MLLLLVCISEKVEDTASDGEVSNAPPHHPKRVRATAAPAHITIAWLPFRAPELMPCEDLWRLMTAAAASSHPPPNRSRAHSRPVPSLPKAGSRPSPSPR